MVLPTSATSSTFWKIGLSVTPDLCPPHDISLWLDYTSCGCLWRLKEQNSFLVSQRRRLSGSRSWLFTTGTWPNRPKPLTLRNLCHFTANMIFFLYRVTNPNSFFYFPPVLCPPSLSPSPSLSLSLVTKGPFLSALKTDFEDSRTKWFITIFKYHDHHYQQQKHQQQQWHKLSLRPSVLI